MADRKHRSPSGYDDFIRRNPDLAYGGYKPWESPDMDLVRSVNEAVNAANRYRPDAPGKDTWGGGGYDCEDYAVTKKRKLLEAGVPPGALRFALGERNGRQHIMLVVNGVVLDNLTNRMYPLTNRGAATHIESKKGWRDVTKPMTWDDLLP